MRTALTAALLAALAAVTAFAVVTLGFLNTAHDGTFILCVAVTWLLFGGALILLRRVPLKSAVVLILAGSVVLSGAAMAGPPNTSTDSARYAWDGIVQTHGTSPYRYVPADDALASLRPDWLFPTPSTSASGTENCTQPRTHLITSEPSGEKVCTAINRAHVPTIYPPLAELYFAGVRAFTGSDPPYWPLQLTGLLMSVGITVLLLVALRRRGLDPRWAALWAWCPLVASEGVTNSHVDVLGALLTLVATLLVSRGMRIRGGIALGAAIATKLIPVIAAPALLRRQPWKVVAGAVVTFALLYVPYVLATGIAVVGYLPGYLSEEGYDDGSRFTLLTLFVPPHAAIIVAGILLAATAALVWWKTNPERPWLGQLVMIGSTLLVVSPRYPWYALLLIPFIALTGRWEWFAVPLALSTRLLIPNHAVSQAAIAIAVVVIVVMALHRTGREGRERLLRSPRRMLARSRRSAA